MAVGHRDEQSGWQKPPIENLEEFTMGVAER
jgi:hypothetical protein